MSTLFRLDASIRTEGSITRRVADVFEEAAQPAFDAVVRREIGLSPLPSTAWRDAILAMGATAETLSPAGREARALATTLADELIAADSYLLAIPLYNFGVAQQAKAWIDLLLTEPRFQPGAPAPLAGKTAWLVTARGGAYGPGTPRAGWDHSTPYLTRIFTEKWGLTVVPIEIELTLADTTPGMEFLRPPAAENLRRALDDAARLGAALAAPVPGVDPVDLLAASAA